MKRLNNKELRRVHTLADRDLDIGGIVDYIYNIRGITLSYDQAGALGRRVIEAVRSGERKF